MLRFITIVILLATTMFAGCGADNNEETNPILHEPAPQAPMAEDDEPKFVLPPIFQDAIDAAVEEAVKEAMSEHEEDHAPPPPPPPPPPRLQPPSDDELNRKTHEIHGNIPMRDAVIVGHDGELILNLHEEPVVENPGDICDRHLVFPDLFVNKWHEDGDPTQPHDEYEGWFWPPPESGLPVFFVNTPSEWYYIGPRLCIAP